MIELPESIERLTYNQRGQLCVELIEALRSAIQRLETSCADDCGSVGWTDQTNIDKYRALLAKHTPKVTG